MECQQCGRTYSTDEMNNGVECNNCVKEHYFEYLDELRESGETNMLGATPYLQDEFDIDKQKARTVLQEWIKSKN